MCYHTTQKAEVEELKKVFDLPMVDESEYTKHFHANGFAHPKLAVIANDGQKALFNYNWGLIPFWVKTPEDAKKLSNQTLNAKAETIFNLPSFRDSIVKRRCVIPVNGFFEWKHVGKEKIPYFVHPKEHPFFLLAGIYSHWKNPLSNELTSTFSIITAEANPMMAEIHNTKLRMPLMIELRNLDAWIDNSLPKQGIIELLQPQGDEDMLAYTVSSTLSSPKVNSDVPEILEEVPYII